MKFCSSSLITATLILGIVSTISTRANAQTIAFTGLNKTTVFGSSGQNFTNAISFAGSSWAVNVKGVINGSTTLSSLVLSNTNQSGTSFQNPSHPNAPGLFLSGINSGSDTVTLTVTFTRTSGSAILPLLVFSAESVDIERDIVTSTANWSSATSSNLSAGLAVDNTLAAKTMIASDTSPGAAGVGSYQARTNFGSSGVVNWTYDPLGANTQANMLGFEVYTETPEPSSLALFGAASLAPLGMVLRRRRK